MAANLFSGLERFREESQVMAAHWSIALNDESLLTQSLSPIFRYKAARAARKKNIYIFQYTYICCNAKKEQMFKIGRLVL